MVLRHLLVCLAIGVSTGLVAAKPEPGSPPGAPRSGGEGREPGPRPQEFRDRVLARRFAEQNPEMMDRVRPFLGMGDPRFEKIARLVFVPEDQLDEAMEVWAAENEMDEQQVRFARQMVTQTRKRLEHQADKYIGEKGLAVDESNREAFLKRFLELQIQAEREIRARAEAELKQAREGIDQRLREEFGPASGG